MSILPTIDVPTYNVKLPVSKQEITFRPYTVKENKLLMMATEAGDKESLVNAVTQIVSNCVLSKINTKELPITDVEFIFYQLRARSESEIVNLRYRCENIIDDNKVCGNYMEHRLNLLTDLEVSDGLSDTIELTDTIGIKLKHQKFEVDKLDNIEIPTPEQLFEAVVENIDFIFDKNSSYQVSDLPKSHVVEFLSQLSTKQYAKIEDFFLNEPKIQKNIQITCKKCGMVHDIKVEDIFDFFI
jgi:hypothetical protein